MVSWKYLPDRCCLASFSGLSSWKTLNEDKRPFFLLPYVVAMEAFWALEVGSYPRMTVMGAGKGEILLML